MDRPAHARLRRQVVAGRPDGHEPAAKLGIRFRIGPLADMPRGIQMQVKAISSEWVEDKGLPEMGFTSAVSTRPSTATSASVSPSTGTRRCTASRRGCRSMRAEGGTPPAGRSMSCDGCPMASAIPWSSSSRRLRDLQGGGLPVVSLSGAPSPAPLRPPARSPRPRHARLLPRPARRLVGALLRIPFPAGLQVQVPATVRAPLPRLPGRGARSRASDWPSAGPTCRMRGCGTS